MNDDEDGGNFGRITAGAFSGVEAQIGTDAYQANVEHTKAMTKYVETRSVAMKVLASLVPWALIMSLPFYAALVAVVFRWAF